MAKVIFKAKEELAKDGSSIAEACEELGVILGCQDGMCGVCQIEVLEGVQNLSPLTKAEKELMMDKKHRLACQCKIKKGAIKVTF